jgi:RND family efflux transporter MFP subunit
MTTNESHTPAWVKRLLPLLGVVAIGVIATGALIKSKKRPQRRAQPAKGVLVEVRQVSHTSRRIRVISQGTVQPKRQVNLSPQVPGKVIWVHSELKVGGMVRSGTPLMRLDPVDYRLALEKARAQLVAAQKNLAETESNAAVAQREWKILGEQTGKREANPLALFGPQLKLARANLRSANAQVEQANVNVARTTIRAPFNLQVRSEAVDKGQYVGVGQTLATVSGTDEAEVIVPLPVSELRWIQLPKPQLSTRGAPKQSRRARKNGHDASLVRVRMVVGGKRFERPGRLLRSVGEIEADGRMARIVVGIDDPYNLQASQGQGFRPDFQLGAFVEVEIQGRQLDDVVVIPATALRLGSTVWIAGPADKLLIREVSVVRLTQDEALISSGLADGDRVVLTTISDAVEGMQLRVKKSPEAKAQASAE